MILVVGATGQMGLKVAGSLLEQGRQVRVLMRRDAEYELLEGAGAQIVFGDLNEPETLAGACLGVETVISTASSMQRLSPDSLLSLEPEGVMALIDAAGAAGVGHFIYTSLLRADPQSPHPLMRIKAQIGEYLKQSGMEYTIVKLGILIEAWAEIVVGFPLSAGIPVTLVGAGKTRQPFVSIDDVTAYLVAAVDNPAARGAEIVVAGPEQVTWPQLVQAIGKAMGRELPVRTVQPGEPVPLLPLGWELGLAYMDQTDVAVDMTETAAIYGVRGTTVEEFAQRFFGGGRP